jgi:hypothetical protein
MAQKEEHMSALKDISNGIIRTAIGNSTLSKAILAINAGGAATVKTTTAILYGVDGILYSKAILAAQSIVPTHDAYGNPIGGANMAAYVQPAGTTAYLLLCLDKLGNVAVVQGSYLNQSQAFPGDLSKVQVGTGQIPFEPAGFTAFGLVKVVTSGAATFTPGTTLLDAANVAATYYDLEYVPTVAP